jgi:hypothetical protein
MVWWLGQVRNEPAIPFLDRATTESHQLARQLPTVNRQCDLNPVL